MKRIRSDLVTIVLFAVLLLLPLLGWLLLPKQTFSESERRYLAEPPALTKQSLRDWQFDDVLETYLADHLPLRDALVGVHAYTTLLSGRQVSTDVWMDREGYLLEAPVKDDPAEPERRMQKIAAVAERTGLPVYVIAVPSAGYVRRSSLPSALSKLYADDAILGRIAETDDIRFVPLLDRFAQEGQHWYYRTDHHWTAEGAFAAYEAFLKTAGHEPLERDAFYHHTVNGYTGSTRSRSALFLTEPDVLQIDEPIDCPVRVTFSDREGAFDSMFFYEHLNEYDWYPLFLDGNHPITVIENRSAASDAPTLVLVKDSFGNTLAPLLAPTYKTIVMVDPRYCRESICALCETYGADEVLFCYSLEHITSDRNLLLVK